MSKWIDAAETALTAVFEETKIPYEFEFWDVKKRGELPDTYIVYFLVSEPSASSADNKERSSIPKVQFSLFYRDISVMQSIPKQIIKAALTAGFTRVNSGRIPRKNDSGHFGWRSDFILYESRGN